MTKSRVLFDSANVREIRFGRARVFGQGVFPQRDNTVRWNPAELAGEPDWDSLYAERIAIDAFEAGGFLGHPADDVAAEAMMADAAAFHDWALAEAGVGY